MKAVKLVKSIVLILVCGLIFSLGSFGAGKSAKQS